MNLTPEMTTTSAQLIQAEPEMSNPNLVIALQNDWRSRQQHGRYATSEVQSSEGEEFEKPKAARGTGGSEGTSLMAGQRGPQQNSTKGCYGCK